MQQTSTWGILPSKREVAIIGVLNRKIARRSIDGGASIEGVIYSYVGTFHEDCTLTVLFIIPENIEISLPFVLSLAFAAHNQLGTCLNNEGFFGGSPCGSRATKVSD